MRATILFNQPFREKVNEQLIINDVHLLSLT